MEGLFFNKLSAKSKFYSMKKISIIYFLCFTALAGQAQFLVNGSASQTGTNCYRLTPDQNNQAGSIWNAQKINLHESFEVILNINLGCRDADGADGMVFGFQPISTSVGAVGGGLGFTGVAPSIGIEMDTWQNNTIGDPIFDHLAIIKNGNLDHTTTNTLAGPIGFTTNNNNIEDCQFHDMRVVWNATTKTLKIFIDCIERLSYTGDIVTDIFRGDPWVFWGFTAATGGSKNQQEVCLNYTTFLDQLPDTTICQGGRIQLNARGGETYSWTPSTGLNNPTIPNPIASPLLTTTYIVTITDKCQRSRRDTAQIRVGGSPLTVELGNDTTLCNGQELRLNAAASPTSQNANFLWQNGVQDSIFMVTDSGTYHVRLERNNCFAADSIRVRYLAPPSVPLPNDTLACLGTRIKLNVENPESKYRWQNGSTQPFFVAAKSGIYFVTITNACGSASKTINAIFNDCQHIFVPNVFTPNKDDRNDIFYIHAPKNNVKNIKRFEIFNRWGNKVFSQLNIQANDPQSGWNGRVNGKVVETSVFVWWAEIEFLDGSVEVRQGDVSVFK